METEKILNKIFAELEEKAYDSEYHNYNYKITNQIIRANIEALMQASFISPKQDVIKSVCAYCECTKKNWYMRENIEYCLSCDKPKQTVL